MADDKKRPIEKKEDGAKGGKRIDYSDRKPLTEKMERPEPWPDPPPEDKPSE